jgi:hypothetical protein
MAHPKPVTEKDLLRLLDEEIAGGVTFDNDDKGDRRSDALDYYDGIMRDLKAEKGRSSIVSRDVADVIDTMLPGLMRVFAGAGQLGKYEPAKPEDEAAAAQATDYVNYVLTNECDGYLLLHTWIKDGLQIRNGIVKCWWDTTPEEEVEDLTGQTEDEITLLMQDQGIDILGHQERVVFIRNPMTGATDPIRVFDLRIRRYSDGGRLRVEPVPPEDFGISAKARSIETARCVWQKTRMTRSDLIKQGYPRDKIDDLPAWDRPAHESHADRDREANADCSSGRDDGAMAEIEITEAYVYADLNGDGVAESLKVVTAGGNGGRKLLEAVEWPDDRPFVDWTPQPVPHRWMGQSAADNVMDLQRVKTALWRGGLDNIYAQNRPQRGVNADKIVDPDEVLNPVFGGIIRTKEAPASVIQDLTVPNIANVTLGAIQAVDGIIQRRTGISGATASLDATALEPQTATAEQLEHDASYARVEMIARNMAELGLKKLFAKLLRIIVRNQDRPRTIRLRNEWVAFDPRSWNAAMDVSVNVGLGTGSRERDLKMLGGIAARQEAIIQRLGPDNPVVKPSMYVRTLHKMVEAAGLRDADSYFASLTDEDFAQWMASRPQPTDPRADAAQARLAADQQKTAARVQGDREKQAADITLDRERQATELQMERERLEQEFALKTEQMNREFQLRMTEMERETQLRAAQIATGVAGVSSNIPRQ